MLLISWLLISVSHVYWPYKYLDLVQAILSETPIYYALLLDLKSSPRQSWLVYII